MNYSELLQLAKGWSNFISDRIIIWRLLLILLNVYDIQIVIIGAGVMYIRDFTGNPKVWSKWAKYSYERVN